MIVAIIQARMGSTRLPRKVARLIAGKTMLARVIERAKQILGVTDVVVATTELEADRWILDESHRYGVRAFQGPTHDVLGRYEGVAGLLNLRPHDLIVRLTADCPLLDPYVSAQVIQLHLANRNDYTSNLRDWPDGLDTEIFTRVALQEAYHWSGNPEDREHVTPWMRRNLFCLELPHEPNLRHVKFSVDTEEDLEYVRELYAALDPNFAWGEIAKADPKKICDLCRQGIPHRRELQREMKIPIIWDLHSGQDGIGLYDPNPECLAWAICQRAAGFPRLTIDAPVPDGASPRSPDDAPAVPGWHGDH